MKKKVFLSYAYEDEKYKLELDKHLTVQKRNEVIDTWNDRKLVAGSEIDEEIKELGWIDWINVYNFYRILRDFI